MSESEGKIGSGGVHTIYIYIYIYRTGNNKQQTMYVYSIIANISKPVATVLASLAVGS